MGYAFFFSFHGVRMLMRMVKRVGLGVCHPEWNPEHDAVRVRYLERNVTSLEIFRQYTKIWLIKAIKY